MPEAPGGSGAEAAWAGMPGRWDVGLLCTFNVSGSPFKTQPFAAFMPWPKSKVERSQFKAFF
jgi:hypothetical protein